MENNMTLKSLKLVIALFTLVLFGLTQTAQAQVNIGETPKAYVLVHGAWHTGATWNEFIPELEDIVENDDLIVAPTLMGSDNNLDTYRDATVYKLGWQLCVDAWEYSEDYDVVVVAHSMGGMVASQAAEYCPEAIDRIIYVAAFLPQNGESLLDLDEGPIVFNAPNECFPFPTPQINPITGAPLRLLNGLNQAPSVGPSIRPVGAHLKEVFKSPCMNEAGDDAIRINDVTAYLSVTVDGAVELFYNDLPEDEAINYAKSLSIQSSKTLDTPVLLGENFDSVPKYYIETTLDNAVNFDFQKAMNSRVALEGVNALETGHSPFLSAPAELAEIVADFATEDLE